MYWHSSQYLTSYRNKGKSNLAKGNIARLTMSYAKEIFDVE